MPEITVELPAGSYHFRAPSEHRTIVTREWPIGEARTIQVPRPSEPRILVWGLVVVISLGAAAACYAAGRLMERNECVQRIVDLQATGGFR